MKRDRFQSWLQSIYETQDEELSCSECFDLVSRFVELEISGENAEAQVPKIKQHLDQCPTCREEYKALRDLVRLEDEGGAPSIDDLQNLIR